MVTSSVVVVTVTKGVVVSDGGPVSRMRSTVTTRSSTLDGPAGPTSFAGTATREGTTFLMALASPMGTAFYMSPTTLVGTALPMRTIFLMAFASPMQTTMVRPTTRSGTISMGATFSMAFFRSPITLACPTGTTSVKGTAFLGVGSTGFAGSTAPASRGSSYACPRGHFATFVVLYT